MVEKLTAELVYLTQVICGEGPVWDEVHHKLYWMDIVSGHIYIFNPENGTNTGYQIGRVMGGLTLCEKGGVLLAMEKGFVFFDPETGSMEIKNNPEVGLSEHFFSDGKCDPKGRFWAGTYHQSLTETTGSLYSLESDFTVKKRLEHLILSNGLTWSMDQKKFYFIDSIARCIYSFDYNTASGNISNKQILKKIQGDVGLPDGMTIDTEGFLWIAVYNAGKIIRINPQSGETVFEVLVPNAKQVTSCTFGGKEFDELYITTAKEMDGPYGIPKDELNSQQNAGGLFKVKLPFKGIPSVRFKG
jgi:sugar lactone lactonase YvrE